ncbi:Tuberin, partial [Stegodyphus mimosarum]
MSSSAIIALHTELMETGLDLMARFTFGMSSNVPKRSPVSEFLLEKGQKSSWLVGNKIITITTSGCGTKSFKHGLCEQCYSSCHDKCKSIESDENDSIFLEHPVRESQQEISSKRESENSFFERKRHRSAIQRRSATLSREMLTSTKQTKDDMLLHCQRFESSDPNNRFQTSYLNSDENQFSHFQVDWTSENKGREDKSNHLCSCWCSSWAEVHIRRPTGNTSWMMKMQNHLFLPSAPPDIPLSVLTSLVLPQKIEDQDADDYFLSSTEDDVLAAESELKEVSCDRGGIEISPCPKSNPPMRRTNSSPDMNTSWSNFQPLMQEERKESFESSMESNQDQLENLTIGSTMEFPSKKDERDVQSSKPSLKLDLSRTKTCKLKSLNFRSDSLNSAPIEKLLNNNTEPQNVVSGSFRDRGHTISVMSPIRPLGSEKSVMKPDVNRRSGMSPSFVFLQLFHDSYFGPPAHKPLLLLPTETNNRALNVLDHTPPYDTHKIGVVYVGPGQVDKEVAILSNVYGSTRYVNFLHGLGSMVRLTDVDPHTTYLGGLDTKGEDGKFALIWHDDVMQVVFHVATLMLNKESDKMRNEKKKHIANDNVIIVYNESGEDYKLSTIKGHVTNACVVIHPEDFNSNVVLVKLKTKELQDMFGHTESYIVSDESLPVFVRQLALHANLASLIMSRRQHSAKYSHVSNWLERLRTIKRLRAKVVEELKSKAENLGFENFSDSSNFDDFTDYV